MMRVLLRPRMLAFTVLVAVAAGVMFNLSAWQFRRLDERREFNALVEERSAAAPVMITSLLDEPLELREWRIVTAVGRYDDTGTIRVETAGGYRLLTPFTFAGRTVVVERGTLPVVVAEEPTPPVGDVTITAQFRTVPEVASNDLPADTAFLGLVASEPAESDLALPPLPSLSEGSHLSYGVQWIIFAVCVLIGWVLAVRRSVRNAAIAGGLAPAETRRNKHVAVPWQDESVPR